MHFNQNGARVYSVDRTTPVKKLVSHKVLTKIWDLLNLHVSLRMKRIVSVGGMAANVWLEQK
jgi:hypothetical protein